MQLIFTPTTLVGSFEQVPESGRPVQTQSMLPACTCWGLDYISSGRLYCAGRALYRYSTLSTRRSPRQLLEKDRAISEQGCGAAVMLLTDLRCDS